MEDDFSGYYDLVGSLVPPGKTNEVVKFRGTQSQTKFDPNDPDTETFITSADIVRIERERAEEDPRNLKKRGELGPNRIEETVYFRYSDRPREIKYTTEELASFREGCKNVIVHDFSQRDFYHASDEDRTRNDKLARISMKLDSVRSLYRNAEEYVVAMRTVYEAWSMFADSDPIFSRGEFFDMVASGKITSPRIIMPTLKGISKFNPEVILRYIANRELDPHDLAPEVRNDRSDNLNLDSNDDQWMLDVQRLLDPVELIAMDQYKTTGTLGYDSRVAVKPLKRKYLRAYTDTLTLRKKKKLPKADRMSAEITTNLLTTISRNRYQKFNTVDRAYGISTASFTEDKPLDLFSNPFYNGSWQDDDSVKLYDTVQWMDNLDNPSSPGSTTTNGDVESNNFFRMLEDQGIPTIELRRRFGSQDAIDTRKKQELRKYNRSIEKKVVCRLQALSNNPRFQKLVKRSEKAANEYLSENKKYDNELPLGGMV